MSNVNREPKGTSGGGRFAPNVNSESTVELTGQSVEHEAPFQIGSVLEYDVEVVPWVPGMYEESVEADVLPAAVQVWMEEFGDADTDCAGWEPRAFAQIARERGITNMTNRDLQDVLDDPDISKIAFRPDTSIATLLQQINDLNSTKAGKGTTPAPAANKQRYVDAIHKNLDDSGDYDPNDEGVTLIEESSMKITGEIEVRGGIAWTGELTIGDEILYVSNNGNGGSNFYQIKNGGWPRIGELNDRVSAGFPGFAGPEALDSFCLVAEVAHAA